MSNPFSEPNKNTNKNYCQPQDDPFALEMGIGGGLSDNHHIKIEPFQNQYQFQQQNNMSNQNTFINNPISNSYLPINL